MFEELSSGHSLHLIYPFLESRIIIAKRGDGRIVALLQVRTLRILHPVLLSINDVGCRCFIFISNTSIDTTPMFHGRSGKL
jgi:hypothetical protein